MRFAYRITKATVRHPEHVILFFHGNSDYADALRCYGIRLALYLIPKTIFYVCQAGAWDV
jgi:hypothetical protein